MEFHSNHGEITQWLEEAESRVDLLEARAESTESPLVSPVELLTDVNVRGEGGRGEGGGREERGEGGRREGGRDGGGREGVREGRKEGRGEGGGSVRETISSPLLQEIEAEMCEKEVLLSAMKATSQNIIEEFSTMKEQGGEGGGEGHSGAGVSDKVHCTNSDLKI